MPLYIRITRGSIGRDMFLTRALTRGVATPPSRLIDGQIAIGDLGRKKRLPFVSSFSY